MASAASKKPGTIKARDGFTSRTLDEPPAEPRPPESALVADGRRQQAQGDPSLKGSFPDPLIVRRLIALELNGVHRRQGFCPEGIEQHGQRRGQHEVIRCGRNGWSIGGVC
jgi:hypothetical protein